MSELMGDLVHPVNEGRADGERYDRLAELLLSSAQPVKAIAHLLGDHEGRLDALVRRLDHVEAALASRRTNG